MLQVSTIHGPKVLQTPLRSIHTCDLLAVNYCFNFSVHTIAKKCVRNQLLNFAVQTKVDLKANVNVPT